MEIYVPPAETDIHTQARMGGLSANLNPLPNAENSCQPGQVIKSTDKRGYTAFDIELCGQFSLTKFQQRLASYLIDPNLSVDEQMRILKSLTDLTVECGSGVCVQPWESTWFGPFSISGGGMKFSTDPQGNIVFKDVAGNNVYNPISQDEIIRIINEIGLEGGGYTQAFVTPEGQVIPFETATSTQIPTETTTPIPVPTSTPIEVPTEPLVPTVESTPVSTDPKQSSGDLNAGDNKEFDFNTWYASLTPEDRKSVDMFLLVGGGVFCLGGMFFILGIMRGQFVGGYSNAGRDYQRNPVPQTYVDDQIPLATLPKPKQVDPASIPQNQAPARSYVGKAYKEMNDLLGSFANNLFKEAGIMRIGEMVASFFNFVIDDNANQGLPNTMITIVPGEDGAGGSQKDSLRFNHDNQGWEKDDGWGDDEYW